MEKTRQRCFYFFLITLLFISAKIEAQTKYFVYFKDKQNSPYSISSPEKFLSSKAIQRRSKQSIPVSINDLPVNPEYLEQLATKGAEVLFSSRWMNSAVVVADSAVIAKINELPFVVDSKKTGTRNSAKRINTSTVQSNNLVTPEHYGYSYKQDSMLGIPQMHDKGFKGKGMLVAVLDAGFRNADKLDVFEPIFKSGRVLATYDFVDDDNTVFETGDHGTYCWSALAGYKPGSLIGPAYEASFLLLRTEDDHSETLSEEVNWLAAAEYADSAGADIISSSLGYSTFDDKSYNHSYADMNGDATIITRAADLAASKGILVVTSAGNEGNDSWKYITAPADADSVITVGAVTSAGKIASFSSVGPTFDDRIKPDLCAQGVSVASAKPNGSLGFISGTSLSCPIIAGFAAGIWQAHPELTNMQVRDLMIKSADRYENPDHSYGYGIPNFFLSEMIYYTADQEKSRFFVFPNPIVDQLNLYLNTDKELGEELSVLLYDITGRVVSEMLIPKAGKINQFFINASDLQHGIYFLSITGRNYRETVRVLKQ